VRALQVTALEGPDGIELVDVPEPESAEGTILVEVRAAGVSFVDLLLSRGEYQLRPEPPFVPGIELAGVVREVAGDSRLRRGEPVMALAPAGGAFAEVAAVPAALTFPLPDSLSFAQGTALNNYCTAVFGLVRRGRLAAGETVLVHGAAGGVGTAAIEVGKANCARVLAVTSTVEKAAIAQGAGADEVLDAADDLSARVRELTSDRGADVIFDPVGGERFSASLRCLAPEGRLLVVRFSAGQIPELGMNRVLLHQADIVGVNWGGFFLLHPEFTRKCVEEVSRMCEAGRMSPLIGREYPLIDGASALRELANRRSVGKLVVIP
jgi:NADPH2:quinone reductase